MCIVRFTGQEGPSGFGFELTFRLKREVGETAPPTWPAELMQGLARYVFQSGKDPGSVCLVWRGYGRWRRELFVYQLQGRHSGHYAFPAALLIHHAEGSPASAWTFWSMSVFNLM